jgi:uncharacterized repeat protein (TIGR01451 family)
MEFFENGGGATARLSWSSASQPKTIIPRSQLYPPAELSLSQTAAPNPVPAGAQLVYTVTATNNGPSYASNITLVDTLPAAVTFVSSTPGSPTCNHSSQVVTCNLDGLVSGQQQAIGIRVSVPLVAEGTTLTNTATLSSQMLDRNLADNSSSLGVPVSGPTAITLRQAAVAGNRLVFPTLLLVVALLGVSLVLGRRR